MVRIAPFARLPRGLRWTARVLVGLLALALILTLLGIWTVRRSFPQTSGTIRLDGLTAPVTVFRDEWGIPQIYADNADDLFRAQGYVHAQDRFWEMDVRRHVTAGRLSELFGESQFETDAFIRTLGWRRVAEQEYALLDADTKRYLDRYADGVNAWLADHTGSKASLEYGVLRLSRLGRDYEPEPWSPIDSLAWLKAMAWDLRSNMEDEIARSLAASTLPKERVDQLYPDYPYDRHRPIVTSGTVEDGKFVQGAGGGTLDPPVAVPPTPNQGRPAPAEPNQGRPAPPEPNQSGPAPPEPNQGGGAAQAEAGSAAPRQGAAVSDDGPVLELPEDAKDPLHYLADIVSELPQLLGPPGSGLGSNSWVVSGVRTTTGKPLLANDPHLAPMLPSLWYQAGLHCTEVSADCPFDLTGFTFSGVPGVIIGHNADIAWGFTNLGPDVSDLYLEKVTGDQYEYRGEQVPLETRNETIRIDGDDSRTITVRSTRHGPLISDPSEDMSLIGDFAPTPKGIPLTDRGEGYAVALRWTALEPGRTAEAIFQLNTAADWSDFRAAAEKFAVPAQNLLYADTEGNIGYQSPGQIPIRTKGDGRWPVPGWTGEYEWDDRIPFDALPSVYNPPSGYLVTANNAVIGTNYPYLLTHDWSYGYRSSRIEQLIRAGGTLDAAAMARIQLDSRNGMAPELVPFLLSLQTDEWVRGGQDLLRDWDFSQPPDSAAAAYYNAVWRHLLIRTFNDELPEDARPDGGDRWFEVVRPLLVNPTDPWWDDVSTEAVRETRDDILRAAMKDARDELTRLMGKDIGRWRWGTVHKLELTNQTFGTSGIAPIEGLFNRGPLRLGGGESIVDATGWNATEGYEVIWVPSMRMVVDLAELDQSRWINLTGASGHAYSDHYWDQARLWARGETTPMRSSRAVVEAAAEHTLTLEPAAG
ncbi:MAG: penicillin acylase family protein [Sporichthyaceae bacterium]|nr:penicillin acylase family protein [Sporichthyaceae bacterium]